MLNLTRTELEVIECVAKGWDYYRIGQWLGIEPSTAQFHTLNIARKLPPLGDLSGYRRVLAHALQQNKAA